MRWNSSRSMSFCLCSCCRGMVRFVGLVLGLLFLLHGAAAQSSDLINAMKQEAASLATAAPGGAFITNVQASGDIVSKAFPVASLDATLGTLGLPAQAVQSFHDIVMVQSLVFKTFSFALGGGQASLSEFIGAARNNGGNVEMAWITTTATGQLVPVYTLVKKKHCKKIVVYKHCHHKEKPVPRG
jgi:hypothetical protein